MAANRAPQGPSTESLRPYPESWEKVAELRVFRTTNERWQQLIGWRTDMRRKGWKLLHVSSTHGEMFAVFGRTRPELMGENAERDHS